MQNWDAYNLRDEVKDQAELTQIERYQKAAYHDKVEELLSSMFRPGDRVLDIGCGIGRWVKYLLDQGVHCEGIDFSQKAIEGSKSYLGEEYNARNVVRYGDASNLEFEPESFDAIISFGLIEHFTNHHDVLRQWLEVVKPGGKVVVSVPNGLRYDWMFFDALFLYWKRRERIKFRFHRDRTITTFHQYEERWTPDYISKVCKEVGLTDIQTHTFYTMFPLFFYFGGNKLPRSVFNMLHSPKKSKRFGLYLFATAQKQRLNG